MNHKKKTRKINEERGGKYHQQSISLKDLEGEDDGGFTCCLVGEDHYLGAPGGCTRRKIKKNGGESCLAAKVSK